MKGEGRGMVEDMLLELLIIGLIAWMTMRITKEE